LVTISLGIVFKIAKDRLSCRAKSELCRFCFKFKRCRRYML
jgi:hypothetical protein